MGPQVDYYSPEILDEYEIHAPGIASLRHGLPRARRPYPLIGHGKYFAWTGTTALGDNADTFAEKLCNPDGSRPTKHSDHYVYNGKCRAFTHRTSSLHTPAGADHTGRRPRPSRCGPMRSVHGPVFGFARSHGHPVALVRATAVYHHGVRSVVAFERLAENKANTPQQFLHDMHQFTGNENWFYVSKKHIAWLASGWFQRRAPAPDLELPIWGTGRYDWRGFKPRATPTAGTPTRSTRTRSIPASGYLASWNNKGAPGWHATPGTWSFGRVQRVQLLRDPARRASSTTASSPSPRWSASPGSASHRGPAGRARCCRTCSGCSARCTGTDARAGPRPAGLAARTVPTGEARPASPTTTTPPPC